MRFGAQASPCWEAKERETFTSGLCSLSINFVMDQMQAELSLPDGLNPCMVQIRVSLARDQAGPFSGPESGPKKWAADL